MTRVTATRRDLLRLGARGAAALAAGAALPAALAGCGSSSPFRGPQAEAVRRTSFAIDYASYYAPYPDIARLVRARARAAGLSVLLTDDRAGSAAQLASLRRLTGDRGGFGVVVVAAFDPRAAAAVTGPAIERGIEIVSFVTPLAHQTTGITVDAGDAAGKLVAHATRWASAHGGRGGVLLVTPPAAPGIPDPFLAYAAEAARALPQALHGGPLRIVATATALGAPDAEQATRQALRAHPEVAIVLTVNDATALGASRALRGAAGPRYVGGLGAPAVATRAPLAAVARGTTPLRCLVAPRLADLADALVDVPRRLLRGASVAETVVPSRVLIAGADATTAALRDYAAA